MQGVVKSYDPVTRQGVILRDDPARSQYDLAEDALVGSIFRMLRQGQRVVFEVSPEGLATTIRIGSEIDMGTPGFTE
jgi:cold shock CspA family protein